jgi:hypothetical protein
VTEPAIYFVQCWPSDGTRYVKIGTAIDVQARIRELQCGNPIELELLGTIVGGRKTEAWIHRRFAELRVGGEWFELRDALHTWLEDQGVLATRPPRRCTRCGRPGFGEDQDALVVMADHDIEPPRSRWYHVRCLVPTIVEAFRSGTLRAEDFRPQVEEPPADLVALADAYSARRFA